MLSLNLGAGECWAHAPEPWVNLDTREEVFEGCTHDHALADILDLPYGDGEAERIYAGHVFEHFPLSVIFDALAEVYRVLAPGRDLWVVGPDAERSASMYADGEVSWERLVSMGQGNSERYLSYLAAGGRPVPGSVPPDDTNNPALHSWVCTGRRMVALCEIVGFCQVQVLPWQEAAGDEDWPIFDRGSADQFAVIAHRQ